MINILQGNRYSTEPLTNASATFTVDFFFHGRSVVSPSPADLIHSPGVGNLYE